MQIENIVRSTFSAINNIENKGRILGKNLSGIIISCYNTIVDFINPIANSKINYIGLRMKISNVENSLKTKVDNKILLNSSEVKSTIDIENNKFIKKGSSNALIKMRSDEIKDYVIGSIIEDLSEKVELNKESIMNFRKELDLNTKDILFFGNKAKLKDSKDSLLNSIVKTISNADEKIKINFGSIDSARFFLSENIDSSVDNILYRNGV